LERLEQLVWLFSKAQLLSYDFQTISHFADEMLLTFHCKSLSNCGNDGVASFLPGKDC